MDLKTIFESEEIKREAGISAVYGGEDVNVTVKITSFPAETCIFP